MSKMPSIEFIRGFAARACQVDESMGEVVLTSRDAGVLSRIAKALLDYGIVCSIGPVGDRTRLRVRQAESLRKWSDLLEFGDERDEKLSRIIKAKQE